MSQPQHSAADSIAATAHEADAQQQAHGAAAAAAPSSSAPSCAAALHSAMNYPAAVPAASASSSTGSKGNNRADADDAADSSPSAAASSLRSDDEEKQSAASSSASAASNPHFVSVVPSVSAPVAGRTKRSEESTRAAAGRILASPMLRLMGCDRGARLSLMQMLSVKDLSLLVTSSRSWSAWIADLPPLKVQIIRVRGSSIGSFARCGWVSRCIENLTFSGRGASEAEVEVFLRCVPRLTRLRSFRWFACGAVRDMALFQESVSAVSPTLQRLQLDLTPQSDPHALTVPSDVLWMTLSSMLTGLVSLEVDFVAADYAPSYHLDFAFLPWMPRLERFRAGAGFRMPICNPEQVESLAQCKALTDLHCGQWVQACQPRGAVPCSVQPPFATLVRRRKEHETAPLRRLYLGSLAIIDTISWQSLSQCTALESIDAQWCRTLTEEDWARLANFQQLRHLSIDGLSVAVVRRVPRVLTNLGHALTPLLQCQALRSLTLALVELSAADAALLAQIPRLESLTCRRLRIESLDPLTAAPALTELTFADCRGVNGEPINIREMIPLLPLVRKLTIEDDPRMNPADAEPYDEVLLQRLPSLTMQCF